MGTVNSMRYFLSFCEDLCVLHCRSEKLEEKEGVGSDVNHFLCNAVHSGTYSFVISVNFVACAFKPSLVGPCSILL